MDQTKKLIAALSLTQRITALLAALLVGAGILMFTRWNRERDFKPLFTSLTADDAGEVMRRLKESGSEFRLAENGSSILVPSERVAELRLDMAAAGVPRSGRIGFELFDKTNFGATDFTEQINYRRALEGELERSVMSLAEVEQARVHLTFPKDSVFLESRQPAKASVLLKLRPGNRLSTQNVVAVSHLVASAVEGLSAEAVSVLDMRGNLLSRPRKPASPDGTETSEATLEYQQKVERDLAAKIHATLEPLLGADRFRAGVSAECDFTSGEQSEESLDPSKSVMLTSQRMEESTNSSGGSGVPGTSSNLSKNASQVGRKSGGVSRLTENVTYQSSRTVRRIKLPQGGIKRISASVLIDHSVQWQQKDGKEERIVVPPSPEKIKVIRDLVAAAIGLHSGRGDQLIVETLPFESTLQPVAMETTARPPAAPAPTQPWNQIWQNPAVMGGAVGSVMLLGSIFFMAARKRKAQRRARQHQPGPPVLAAVPTPAAAAQPASLPSPQMPALEPARMETLSNSLREMTAKDANLSANIIRGWLASEKSI